VICCGDQRRRSPRSTARRSRGTAISFAIFGRCARRWAVSSARQARYRSRWPAAATSRDTVDGARPRRLAITRHESPASSPREISSRSGSDSRNADWGVDRGFTPPVLTNNRCTDFAEHPSAVAAPSCVSPARTRRWSSNRSAHVNRCPGPEPFDERGDTGQRPQIGRKPMHRRPLPQRPLHARKRRLVQTRLASRSPGCLQPAAPLLLPGMESSMGRGDADPEPSRHLVLRHLPGEQPRGVHPPRFQRREVPSSSPCGSHASTWHRSP
jgi:hypothetical protein